MTDRELMQQALDAYNNMTSDFRTHKALESAMWGIHQRLAQPEPEPVEPVAWRLENNGRYSYCDDMTDFPTHEDYGWEPLYTAPPQREWQSAALRIGEDLSSVGPNGYYEMTAEQWLDWAISQNPKGKTSLPQREWVGMTDEEIMKITGVTSADSDWNVVIVHKWIREIEQALKEKNGG